MRPMFHPAIEEVTVEAILHALSDPVRVAIYADIVGQDCPQNFPIFLHMGKKPIPKSTLSQHFRILREAGLIRSERRGVELQNKTRWDEYSKRFGPMISGIIEAYARDFAAAQAVKA